MVETVVRGVSKKNKSHHLHAHGLEVGRCEKYGNKSLVHVIDREEKFVFCLYIHTPRETSPLSLFTAQPGGHIVSLRCTESSSHDDGDSGCANSNAI